MNNKTILMSLAVGCMAVSSMSFAQQVSGPIVVQGAMPVEAERFAQRLDNPQEIEIGGWRFWRGTVEGYPVVVSETLKGMSNASAATAIAATQFHPVAIINQGTAGGHDPALKVYDIVLGKYSVNLGAFKSPHKQPGEGSDSLQWKPMDLLASKGSAGEDKKPHTIRKFPADAQLLSVAESVKASYSKGNVVEGVIGSADMWNSELDRIQSFHRQYQTSVEEMETASASQIAAAFDIPFIGIRVLSNNITNQGAYDPQTGLACQDYVYQVVKAYIAKAKTR
ncbi:5'-methylthioadenosine/S-adenosylhomocysteine nucleosidase [Scandinavium goeteborgense]|uniref:5'-methylthioadenosine/S-adenosylhomocysteine nucleosidase n=1 Tax=Scandinavium goeteborgense TaxID=1851514 RepID=UPI000F65F85C|nr:5'-methylthioadenosine/S-adenosylhomocysteine nucleosidase [Scandinavium goeteborgense]QKN81286.1 5'-methylthioadenosine/S-adenosylhomocysteine nucleosidase [Scandinavium goeteborgense]